MNIRHVKRFKNAESGLAFNMYIILFKSLFCVCLFGVKISLLNEIKEIKKCGGTLCVVVAQQLISYF